MTDTSAPLRYIGALSNSGRKAANLTGFYKGIQSAGAAVFWHLDSANVSYNSMFGATVRSLFPTPLLTSRGTRTTD